MKNVVAVIPTWLVARHALGAWKSLRKYYPKMPIFIIDDKFDEKDIPNWNNLYHAKHYNKEVVFDPDYTKLVGLPNTAYIQVPKHKGVQGEGHGYAMQYAMKFLHAKWIFHLSSDTRIIKEGIIEWMMKDINDKCCGIGQSRQTKSGLPSILKSACMFRGSLLHQYGLHFRANLKIGADCGSEYFDALIKKNYYIKYLSGLRDYVLHLRHDENNPKIWEKYY